MKNGLLTLLIMCLLFAFSSCKTKKNIQSRTEFYTASENNISSKSTAVIADTASIQIHVKDSLTQTEYSRKFEFDTIGNIRSVSETWRNTGRTQLSAQQYGQRTISLESKNDSSATVETSRVASHEKTNETNDSRLVQGREWFWIILGGFAVLSISGYFILERN